MKTIVSPVSAIPDSVRAWSACRHEGFGVPLGLGAEGLHTPHGREPAVGGLG